MSTPTPDVMIHDHGTIAMVEPVSEAAKAWVEQQMGPAFACEPRMVADLVDGMAGDGLEVGR